VRKQLCAANWKMHKTGDEATAFVERFMQRVDSIPRSVDVVLCPPFTALHDVRGALAGAQGEDGRVKLGAQNMHWEAGGAFTGEISAPMLRSLGVQYVIVGHSERRQYFGETDEMVALKTAAALRSGIVPIVAVGESLATRRAGGALDHVLSQVRAALGGLQPDELRRVSIAYEPIWAIGTGQNCDPNDANEIMSAIRSCLPGLENVPILYGGSVKPGNIAAYTAQPDVDGGLVGGASLDPDGFAALAAAAAK